MTAELASIRKDLDNIESKFYDSNNISVEVAELKLVQTKLLMNIAESLDGLNRK